MKAILFALVWSLAAAASASHDDVGLLQQLHQTLPRQRGDKCYAPEDCQPSSTCHGGHGEQPCSTCQWFGCRGNGGGHCTCNNDGSGLWFGNDCWAKDATDHVARCLQPDAICAGGNGPQPCSTCQKIECNSYNGCCCNGNC